MSAPQVNPSNPAPAVQRTAATISEKDLEGLLEKVLEKTEKARGEILVSADGATSFGNWEGIMRYASVLVDAGVVPLYGKKDDPPEPRSKVLARTIICINLGRRVGLNPEDAVQHIYVVNNRATLYGDAPLAICRQHKDWIESGFKEYWEIDGKFFKGDPPPEAFKKDATAAICETLRRGASEPKVKRFSMGHAKAAGLIGRNAALYGGYPQRMLLFRARGYCLRDNFGDALKGIGIKEVIEYEDAEEVANRPKPFDAMREAYRENGNNGNSPALGAAVPSYTTITPDLGDGSAVPASAADSGGDEIGQMLADDPLAAEDLERTDFIRRMEEQIAGAKTAKEKRDVGASLTANRDYLGHDEFERLCDSLNPGKVR